MGKAEIEQLKAQIKSKRDAAADGTLQEKAVAPLPKLQMKNRRVLKGHFAKIYAMHWAEGQAAKRNLVSASQDGKLIVWNALSANKAHRPRHRPHPHPTLTSTRTLPSTLTYTTQHPAAHRPGVTLQPRPGTPPCSPPVRPSLLGARDPAPLLLGDDMWLRAEREEGDPSPDPDPDPDPNPNPNPNPNSNPNQVACGGLDNICSIYNLDSKESSGTKVARELAAHTGYLSCCRFVSDSTILCASCGLTSCGLTLTPTPTPTPNLHPYPNPHLSPAPAPAPSPSTSTSPSPSPSPFTLTLTLTPTLTPTLTRTASGDMTCMLWDVESGANLEQAPTLSRFFLTPTPDPNP